MWHLDMERVRAFVTGEYIALIVIVVAGALLFVFMRLAGAATGGTTPSLDIAIIEMFRSPGDPAQMIGSFGVREAVRDLTALGSFSVLTIVILAAIAFLLLTGRPGAALFMAVAVLGGTLLSEWLKDVFARPRPEYSAITAQMSASFPSGHAMLSAVTYLTIGALLARVTDQKRLRGFYIGMAIFLTVLVGITRIALGVHYPSDVLAGWTLGAAWAMACSTVAYFLARRLTG